MLTLQYRHTSCFLIPGAGGRLLAFDAGWPCSLGEYRRLVKAAGGRVQDLAWVVVSHMHMDHAGLLGEFQEQGMECWLMTEQAERIDEMERLILRNTLYRDYRRIDRARVRSGTLEDLNALLAARQVAAELVRTPGHTDDSVSLLTAEGAVLIGDLPPRHQLMADDRRSLASWDLLEQRGATRAFPAHGASFAV